MAKRSVATCAFCGMGAKDRGQMIASANTPPTYICSGCVQECVEVFAQQKQKASSTKAKMQTVPSPKDLYQFLDRHVIGQDIAKKRLCVRVVNHYRHLYDADEHADIKEGAKPIFAEYADVKLEKENMLLFGPTGTGKTLLAKTIAQKLNVPFAMADATTLTEAGYVGDDVENILLKLLMAADYNLDEAQRGIVYIDEIDKKCRTTGNVSITRDVSGEGVQQALLKILEGTIASIAPQGGRKHPEQQCIQMDTSNILFICGGAFNGLADIVAQRLNRKRIGFGSTTTIKDHEEEEWEFLRQVEHEDLIKFGLIPEFVGRLPVIVPLKRLEVPELVRVLKEPENALLKQQQKMAAYMGVSLSFTDGAVQAIAEKAFKKETGARGLVCIISEFMDEILFEINDSHKGSSVVIDERIIDGSMSVHDLLGIRQAA
jgi:ATP-dependent Clp protease ATP-binding subunit ClpX